MASSLNGTGVTFSDGSTQSVGTSGTFAFNSGYGSSAAVYGCRSWVNFNGVSFGIRASGNVSSVTDNGVGLYSPNFSTALVDANYAMTGTATAYDTGGNRTASVLAFAQNGAGVYALKNTSSYRVATWDNNGDNPMDCFDVSIAIFR